MPSRWTRSSGSISAAISTFALLLEAQKRKHTLSYYTTDKLALRGSKVFAAVRPLSVRDKDGDHFTLGEPETRDLSSFDVILMRQDPPFDMAYISATHLLERIHPKTLVVNDPAHVRNAPEKMFVMDYPDLMPPTTDHAAIWPRSNRSAPSTATS